MSERVWLITGVSSGFGRELARAALDRGDIVAGTVRLAGQIEEFARQAPGRAFAYQLDVTDAPAIAPVIDAVSRDCGGRIDILVNNAGYGLMGAVEEVSDAETRRMFETNFFGLLNVTRAVLPLMRARRRGHIFNFSSLAGILGMPGVGLYCAAKFAVEGLSESLAGEVQCFGIKVTIVEPGGFRTDFAGRSVTIAARELPDYAGTPATHVRSLPSRYHGHEPGDPVKGMQAILAAADAEQSPLRLVLGTDALQAARAKLVSLAKNYDTWDAVSNGTNILRC